MNRKPFFIILGLVFACSQILNGTDTDEANIHEKLWDALWDPDNKQEVQNLIKEGANVNTRFEPNEDTPLHIAAFIRNNEEMIKLLLREGADVNAINKRGETPLKRALAKPRRTTQYSPKRTGSRAIILIEAGADVNAIDRDGRTPLFDAVLIQYEEVVDALIKKGVNVNATDKKGYTPLHIAAAEGHKRIVEKLTNAGADVTLKNKEGKTPADIAENEEIEEYLRKKEAEAAAKTGKKAPKRKVLTKEQQKEAMAKIKRLKEAEKEAAKRAEEITGIPTKEWVKEARKKGMIK